MATMSVVDTVIYVFLCLYVINGSEGYHLGDGSLSLRRSRREENTECTLPKQPRNGNYTIATPSELKLGPGDSVASNTILSYKCKPNFQLVPNRDFIPCIKGKWVYNIPKCAPTCAPRVSSNVDFVCSLNGLPLDCADRLPDGAVASMKCKAHLTLKTPPEDVRPAVFCIDGFWDYPSIECEPLNF